MLHRPLESTGALWRLISAQESLYRSRLLATYSAGQLPQCEGRLEAWQRVPGRTRRRNMRIFAAILTFILAQASTLTTEQRRETVRAMEKALIEGYIDESVGRRVAEGLEKRVVTGEFDTQPDATTLATALERALHAEHEDKHFLVWH